MEIARADGTAIRQATEYEIGECRRTRKIELDHPVPYPIRISSWCGRSLVGKVDRIILYLIHNRSHGILHVDLPAYWIADWMGVRSWSSKRVGVWPCPCHSCECDKLLRHQARGEDYLRIKRLVYTDIGLDGGCAGGRVVLLKGRIV